MMAFYIFSRVQANFIVHHVGWAVIHFFSFLGGAGLSLTNSRFILPPCIRSCFLTVPPAQDNGHFGLPPCFPPPLSIEPIFSIKPL